MSGETNVGSIVGLLRLDGQQFHEEVAQAIAELKLLSGTDVNINVDSHALSSEVPAAAAAAGRALDDVDRKAATVGQDGQRSFGLLRTAIFTLGPALVPLSAGLVGLGGAIGGMAIAGIAAFQGIKSEMQSGTAVGNAYRDGIARVETELGGLARTAAVKVLGDFQVVVSDLSAKMPFLSRTIGDLATMTGHAASAFIDGLLNAFVTLQPYIQDAVLEIDRLALKFEGLGSSNGLSTFAQYVGTVMPQVISFIGQVIVAVIHLAEAIAPFGSGILTILQIFVNALNEIPVPILTQLAQLALSVFAGFKTWEAITGIVEGVIETLKALNTTLEITEGVLRNASIAASVIGIAVAAFTLILAHNAEVTEEAKAKQDAYAEALRESKGAIDDNVRSIAAKQLAEEGAFEQAKLLGLSLEDVTSAALGQGDAVERVSGVLNAYSKSGTQAAATTGAGVVVMSKQATAADKLREAIFGQSEALQAEVKHQAELRDATSATTSHLTAQELATQMLAAKYGLSTTAFMSATKAQKDDAASLAATTAKMQMESDAAGLLKQALDALNGKAITAAEAQQQFDATLVNMTKAQDSAGHSVRITTRNIDDQKTASVTVRGQLDQQVQALERVVEANGGLSNSTGHAREQMLAMRKQIIENAVAHGVDRAAVTAYIDKLLKIPKKVPPTKLEVDKKAADDNIQEHMRLLSRIPRSLRTTVTTTFVYHGNPYPTGVIGGAVANAARRFHGGIDSFRDGGFRGGAFQSFADGKLPSQAMIAPDGANLVQWAERGTGGEAFIPLAPANRARSVAIWEETGRLLGVQAAAQSLKGIEITGTLQTPWGPSQIRGVVKSEMKAAASQARVNSRAASGVNR